MPAIKTIIFDLGGVLLNIDYHLTRQAFAALGVGHFDELYSQSHANELFSRLEKGEIAPDEFYKAINQATGLSLSPQEIEKAWNAMLLDFRESALLWLERIKPHYQLALLSNTNCIHMEAFRKIYFQKSRTRPFEEYFHKAFYSFDLHERKPDLSCFHKAIDLLQIRPEEAIFVDDSVQNVEAATDAGIRSYQLKDGEQVEQALPEVFGLVG